MQSARAMVSLMAPHRCSASGPPSVCITSASCLFTSATATRKLGMRANSSGLVVLCVACVCVVWGGGVSRDHAVSQPHQWAVSRKKELDKVRRGKVGGGVERVEEIRVRPVTCSETTWKGAGEALGPHTT